MDKLRSISAYVVAASLLSITTPAIAAGKVSVSQCTYGHGKTLNCTAKLKGLCNGKTVCMVRVDPPTLGGDPVPGVTKTVTISWGCGDEDKEPAEAQDFNTITLNCK